MPEASGGEKTLPASAQKRQRAREEGNIAKSQDLNSAVALLVALAALHFLGPHMIRRLVEAGRFFFGQADLLLPDKDSVQPLAIQALSRLGQCTLPFMLIMVLGGLTANFLQVGILFTAKPMTPKLERLNPISGLGKFFSVRSLVELVKSLLKLFVIGYIVWVTLWSQAEALIVLMELTPRALVPALGGLVVTVWWRIALAMVVLGILDIAFQRWQHSRDLMMTHQEAKQEAKELEGDPRLKARVRQIQRQMAMQRMMAEVPTADVIITNPTTYAVALRYAAAEMPAPVIVAKGARLVADKIRALALEHTVPVVRKPELAQALYRTIEVGQPIPEHLFRAVAEVLAYVYEVDRRAEKISERRQHLNPAPQAV